MSDQPSTPVVEHPRPGQGEQDPSPLTIQLVQREVAQLHDLRAAELEGLRREIVTRLDGMDKALAKVEDYPTDVDRAMTRLREFFDEKFRSVEARFCENDKRLTLRDEDLRELLDERRQASERAINKAEMAVKQQLDSQFISLRDMKERLDREEGKASGALSKTEATIKLWGVVIATIMVLLTMTGIVVTVISTNGNNGAF